MRTIDLRIALEDAGATLTIEGRKLVVAEPLGGLTPQLRGELVRHEGALLTLLSLYPCGDCRRWREAFAGPCGRCPQRPSWRRKRTSACR